MRVLHKILLNLIVIVTFFVIFYLLQTNEYSFNDNFRNLTVLHNDRSKTTQIYETIPSALETSSIETRIKYNAWCIFTKVTSHAPMKQKFYTFVDSLVRNTIEKIGIHIITDHSSREIAEQVLDRVKESTHKNPMVSK